MKTSRLIVLSASLVLVSANAMALTLTNRDDVDQELTISEMGQSDSQIVVVQPGTTLQDFCAAGCKIILSTGGEGEFEGNEVVTIEQNQFVVTP